MQEYGHQRGLRRVMIPVPFLTPTLSSWWLGLVTPIYARVGRKLIESFQEQGRKMAEQDKALVVVTTPTLRRDLSSLVRQAVPDGLVLTYKEVPESKRINVVAVIGASE